MWIEKATTDVEFQGLLMSNWRHERRGVPADAGVHAPSTSSVTRTNRLTSFFMVIRDSFLSDPRRCTSCRKRCSFPDTHALYIYGVFMVGVTGDGGLGGEQDAKKGRNGEAGIVKHYRAIRIDLWKTSNVHSMPKLD